MTVVDRYLMAVRVFLPKSAQRDVIAELSEDLRSRVDDRESALGRPLTEAEQEAMVAELGHPALLAGRYGPRRHLIGPEIFPFYWLVLRLAVGVGVAVQAAVTIAMLAGGKVSEALRQATVVLPLMVWVQFGIITLVFAALDAYGVQSRIGRRWSTRTLPTMDRQVQPLVHIVVTALYAGWWVAALRQPVLIFGPASAVVRLAPIWHSLAVPMVLLAMSSIGLQALDLMRPEWLRFRSLVRVIVTGLSLAFLYVLLGAGEWLVFTDAARPSAGLQRVIEVVNQSIPWVLTLVAVAHVGAMLPRLRLSRTTPSGVIA